MSDYDLTRISGFLQFAESELASSEKIEAQTNFRDLSEWSSLNALIFISSVNDSSGVLISSGELAGCTTFQDIFELIQAEMNGST